MGEHGSNTRAIADGHSFATFLGGGKVCTTIQKFAGGRFVEVGARDVAIDLIRRILEQSFEIDLDKFLFTEVEFSIHQGREADLFEIALS